MLTELSACKLESSPSYYLGVFTAKVPRLSTQHCVTRDPSGEKGMTITGDSKLISKINLQVEGLLIAFYICYCYSSRVSCIFSFASYFNCSSFTLTFMNVVIRVMKLEL